jgi:hypothetical protein
LKSKPCGCSCGSQNVNKGDSLALRAGFAAASLLGVVTSFGTTLWVASVVVLAGLVVGLVAAEVLPRARDSR